MKVKDLKKILEIHRDKIDEYKITIFNTKTGERYNVSYEDIDLTCGELFEINISSKGE